MKKIIIGSDLSGFQLKEAVKEYLQSEGYTITDVGVVDEDKPAPFYVVGKAVAEKITDQTFERGIAICGTGMGMSLTANKFEGVRAAAVESLLATEKCRAINDANVLCMGGWLVAPFLGVEMAKTFLNTGFTENLEDWRAEKLKVAKVEFDKIEAESFSKKR